jgi:hypothetical protein
LAKTLAGIAIDDLAELNVRELAFQFDDPLLGCCILRRRPNDRGRSSAELAAPNQITRQTDASDDDERNRNECHGAQRSMRDHFHPQGSHAPTHRAPLIRRFLILECPAGQFCRRRRHVAAIDREFSAQIASRAPPLNMLWVKAAHHVRDLLVRRHLSPATLRLSLAGHPDTVGVERFKVMERTGCLRAS